jgi:glycosyltransferase involved in cell wall biosynthesis
MASITFKAAKPRSMATVPMTDQGPRITIVTINYNMREELEKTIKSVFAQTYPNLEYIVVDGASTDGSVGVIRRHEHRITRWISERDRNLYDAMNKGAAMATGEWVLFMNSGDQFADARVVSDIFTHDVTADDIIYGHVIWRYEQQNFEHLTHAGLPETLPARMFCSHQSLFARTDLLRQFPFDLNLLISDYDFLAHCLALRKRFHLVDRVVAIITKGGRSDVARPLVLRQQQQVLARYGMLTWRSRLEYPLIVIFNTISLMVREKLPIGLSRWILARKLN